MSMLTFFQQNILFHFMKITQIKKTILSSIAIAVVAISSIAPGAYAATGQIPGVVASDPVLFPLSSALKAADLETALLADGPFTLFAPTEDAFKKLPAGVFEKLFLPINKVELQKILKFHVVSGTKKAADLDIVAATVTDNRLTTLEGSKLPFSGAGATLKINVTTSVVKADITATNGIIHTIDSVLLPPTFKLTDLKDAPKVTANIVDTAVAAPDFSTLVAAVKAAGLVDTLTGTGPFTVLAPTNAAFAKIPADTLAKLLLPENKAILTKILTYHVISGKVDAAQVVKLTTANTVEGSSIKIAVVNSKVKLNDTTTVIATDIMASNGIIHSIDSVLIPPSVDLTKLVGTATKATVRTGGQTQTIALMSVLCIIAFGLVSKFRTSK
jgi:transforming growth factor-beta-induced protein